MSQYLYHKCVECNYRYYGGQDSSTPCPYCEIALLTEQLAEKTALIDILQKTVKSAGEYCESSCVYKAENASLKEEKKGLADSYWSADQRATEAEAKLAESKKRLDKLEMALCKIIDPISVMRERAAKEGSSLDGMIAVRLSEDHNYLKSIAKEAIRQSQEKE